MASQVTQCPKCQTSFRVTEAQLNIANGAVRCGSCLYIFDAPDHWLTNHSSNEANLQDSQLSTQDQTTASPWKPTTELKATEAFRPDQDNSLDNIFDDDIFNDDDLDRLVNELTNATDFDDHEQPSIQNPSSSDNHHLADENEQRYSDTGLQPATDNPDDLIIDDDLIGQTDKIDDSYKLLDKVADGPTFVFKDLDNIGEDNDEHDESWAEKLLEEETESPTTKATDYLDIFEELDEPDDDQNDALLMEILNQPKTVDPEAVENKADVNNGWDEQPPPEDQFILGGDAFLSGENSDSLNQTLLSGIEPEPVEITTPDILSRWPKRAWWAAITGAILLLFAQYIHYNMGDLARNPSYRPFLASTCSILGCKLPELDNISKIRSSNLIVRSHPSAQQALIVDAIITNHANFKQPFPLLELQFTNLSGTVIAGRRFTPENYLAGELAGKQSMPIKQPIHIALEIIDPGEQAVNYQLSFHRNVNK